MKTIMIAVKPKWAELEMNGKKTIEVRKFYIEPPFKVVNYVTKEKSKYTKEEIYANVNYDWADYYNLKGKVVYEYVVNKVDTIINDYSNFYIKSEDVAYTNRTANQSCLGFPDLKNYLKSKNGYAWHISDLKIYDKPKELGEFRKICTMSEIPYCPVCKFGNIKYSSNEVECSRDIEGANGEWLCTNFVTRPPQNFVYVREVQLINLDKILDMINTNNLVENKR